MTRRLAAVLAGAVLALGALSPAALAATGKVSLGQGGPNPATITVAKGDKVVITNDDTVDHTVKSTSKGFALSATLKPKASVTTASLQTPGTYDYSDSYTVLGLPAAATGHVVVPSPASPSPSPSSSPRPSASPTRPIATSAPTTDPTSSPTPAATQSGSALGPGLIPGDIPTVAVTGSVGPGPQVAPGAPSRSSSSTPVPGPASGPTYAPSNAGVVQHSSHGLGLPTMLAVIAIVGVLTVLVRLLLAQPEAGRAEPTL